MKKSPTHHQLGEHGIQLLHGWHGQRGLHGLQGEAAVIAQPVRDLGVVAAAEAAEDEGDPPAAPLPRGHGHNPVCPSLLGTRSCRGEKSGGWSSLRSRPAVGGGIEPPTRSARRGRAETVSMPNISASDLTFTVLATLTTTQIKKMDLLCLVPELAEAGVRPLSPWDEESWATRLLPIPANLHQPPCAMAARPVPLTPTNHIPSCQGYGKFRRLLSEQLDVLGATRSPPWVIQSSKTSCGSACPELQTAAELKKKYPACFPQLLNIHQQPPVRRLFFMESFAWL